MTREQIIKLAREAGFDESDGHIYRNKTEGPFHLTVELERFAALVAAAERESLVRVCETWVDWPDDGSDYHKGYSDACNHIANALKKRGQS